MRSFIYLFAGLILVATFPGQLRSQNLYVLENSGQQTSYAISDIGKLSFSSGTMIVEMMEGTSESYMLDDIRYLNFIDLVGISEKPVENVTQVNLFPNPAGRTLHVEYFLPDEGRISIDIISMDGRQVHSETWAKASGEHSWQTDVSSFAPGIFFFRLYSDKVFIVKKIIKK
jgi:hypothetical protein